MSVLCGPVLVRDANHGLAPRISKNPLVAAGFKMEKEFVVTNLVELINESLNILRRNSFPAAVVAVCVVTIVASFEDCFGCLLGL